MGYISRGYEMTEQKKLRFYYGFSKREARMLRHAWERMARDLRKHQMKHCQFATGGVFVSDHPDPLKIINNEG